VRVDSERRVVAEPLVAFGDCGELTDGVPLYAATSGTGTPAAMRVETKVCLAS
jgi:hypothetical protein